MPLWQQRGAGAPKKSVRSCYDGLLECAKVVYICGASTTDERLRCLRATVLELLQVQRYAFHLEVQYYEGEADGLCENTSRMLAVLAPLLTLGELNELVLLST